MFTPVCASVVPGDAADLCDGAGAALDQDPRQRRPLHCHQPSLHLGVCQVGGQPGLFLGVRKDYEKELFSM